MSRQRWALVLALLTTLVVIYLSLGNGLQLQSSWLQFAGVDKVQHFAAYAVLGVLWGAAIARRLHWQLLWVALFVLGAVLELCQWAFYPNRYFEFADMLANGVGAGVGCYFFHRIFPH